MAVEEDNVFIEDDVFAPRKVLFVPFVNAYPQLYPTPVLFIPFNRRYMDIPPRHVLQSLNDEYKELKPMDVFFKPVLLLNDALIPMHVFRFPVVLNCNACDP